MNRYLLKKKYTRWSCIYLYIKSAKLLGCMYVTRWLMSMEEYLYVPNDPKSQLFIIRMRVKVPQVLTRMRIVKLYAHAQCRAVLGRIFIAKRNVVLRRSLNKEPDLLNLKVKGKCLAVVCCVRHNHLALILCYLYFLLLLFFILALDSMSA